MGKTISKNFNEFSKEEKDKILELHNQGLLNKEVAEIFNTSKTMIARLLRSMNVESRHPLLTEERKKQIVKCYIEYQNLSKVEKIMKCQSPTIKKVLGEYGISMRSVSEIHRKYKIDENYFEVIDTPNKAYSLGLIYADGTVYKNGKGFAISLQARDKQLLDLLNNEFGGNRKLGLVEYSKKNENWQDQYYLAISCQKMNSDLVNNGAVPNKSLILEFPDFLDDELIPHFIRGYMDGDGSISKKEDRCNLISTENFCNRLAEIIKIKLNIHATIIPCHNEIDKPTRCFQIAGKYQVKRFLDWIYQDAEIFMERKHDLYLLKYYSNVDNSLSV